MVLCYFIYRYNSLGCLSYLSSPLNTEPLDARCTDIRAYPIYVAAILNIYFIVETPFLLINIFVTTLILLAFLDVTTKKGSLILSLYQLMS